MAQVSMVADIIAKRYCINMTIYSRLNKVLFCILLVR